MNGWETFLTATGGLIAALGGFEFIKYLMNKNSNDRIMAAKAFHEERKTILEDYARIQKEVDRMQALIDELRKRVKFSRGKSWRFSRKTSKKYSRSCLGWSGFSSYYVTTRFRDGGCKNGSQNEYTPHRRFPYAG